MGRSPFMNLVVLHQSGVVFPILQVLYIYSAVDWISIFLEISLEWKEWVGNMALHEVVVEMENRKPLSRIFVIDFLV